MRQDSVKSKSSDVVSLFRAFTTVKVSLNYVCDQVKEGLYASLRSKAKTLIAEDLENGLFILGKDLHRMQSGRTLSLEPLLTVHPLMSLRKGSLSPRSSALVDLRINRLIREEVEIVHKYQWTLKALEFIEDLSVFWGLISPDNFAYRERATGSLVIPR